MFTTFNNFVDRLAITKVANLSLSNRYLSANILLNQYKITITENSALNAIKDKEEKQKVKRKYFKLLLRFVNYDFQNLTIEFFDAKENLVFTMTKIKNHNINKLQYAFMFWFVDYFESNKEKFDITY